jgi:hypothetical protein
VLADTGDGRVQVTAAGESRLAEIVLYEPGPAPLVITPVDVPVVEVKTGLTPPPTAGVVDSLVDTIKASAIDSGHADRFEHAVRDAFAFLGFEAEWLGGSGKTDVLLDALLGKNDTYRVIVDCKTSASGSVSDQQVDWVTLTEHKAKHDAQYILVVAPRPSGSRLFERAKQYKVTVMSAEQLGGLCRQHAKTPLGLDDYRSLFMEAGILDTRSLDERAEEVGRLLSLAGAVCDAIRHRSESDGRRDQYSVEGVTLECWYVLTDMRGTDLPVGLYLAPPSLFMSVMESVKPGAKRLKPQFSTALSGGQSFDELSRKNRDTHEWQNLGTQIAQGYKPRSW